MRCKWCGYESTDPEAFEEDNNHRGFWCPECDYFTYFPGMEVPQISMIMLEENSDSESLHKTIKIKYDKRISPLRYPGGKSKMVSFVGNMVREQHTTFVEPFCGGSSVGLALLSAGIIDKLVLNTGVYSLFRTICTNPGHLADRINEFVPSKESYFRFRSSILSGYAGLSELEAGFEFLAVNRMAYSGICKANPMGNIAARYNPEDLVNRIYKISSIADKISVIHSDAAKVIEDYYWDQAATLFVDPPYYVKGKALYNKFFTDAQHRELAELIESLYCGTPGAADFIVTYDNADFIRLLYWFADQKVLQRKFVI